MKKKLLILIIVLGVIAIVVFYVGQKNKPDYVATVCTQEAKMCPDGSYVGRSGPKCEFAQCPAIKTDTKVKIGDKVLNNGIFITPIEVSSDSRCPVDVKCIQAGTVTLKVKLQLGTNSEEKTLTLGKSVSFGGRLITLVLVTPAPHSKQVISPSDYEFEFSVR